MSDHRADNQVPPDRLTSDDLEPPQYHTEVHNHPEKLPKEAIVVALIGLIVVTGGAVAALAFNAIVHGGGTDELTTISAVGVGGLVAALGARQNQQ